MSMLFRLINAVEERIDRGSEFTYRKNRRDLERGSTFWVQGYTAMGLGLGSCFFLLRCTRPMFSCKHEGVTNSISFKSYDLQMRMTASAVPHYTPKGPTLLTSLMFWLRHGYDSFFSIRFNSVSTSFGSDSTHDPQ